MKHESSWHDGALLLARGVLGASIAAHGAQKLFGWFGGPGVEGASQFFGSLGFKPADTVVRLASISELAAGVLIATGTGGPIGPMLLTSTMAVAVGSVHWKNGFFASNQGWELNALYATLALVLAVEDHGRYSIDELLGVRDRTNPLIGMLAIAGGIGAAAYVLTHRELPLPPTNGQQAASSQAASPTEVGTLGEPAENITPATQ